MTTWLKDENGNRCSVEYFGSEEATQKALDSLKNCRDCTNCSYCSYCSGCSDCSRCSGCYPLSWLPCDPKEDGAAGMWRCLDCGDSMYADAPNRNQTETGSAS